MKIMHLSDLHIGKQIYEQSLIEDQKYILNQILQIIKQENVTVLMLCGDIYDRAIPPSEAVLLFDYFLTELKKMNIKVLMIAGNHDSKERLSYAKNILENDNIFIETKVKDKIRKISIEDVDFYLLPYTKPIDVKEYFPEVTDYTSCIKELINNTDIDKSRKNIILSHQFVTGSNIDLQTSDSEVLSLGGMDNVDISVYNDFDYVALGHIHRSQKLLKEEIRYSGSILKYSFSESKYKKSVPIIDTTDMSIVLKELFPFRDLKDIEGNMDELLKNSSNDYIRAILTDEEELYDPINKLRKKYPNILKIEFKNKRSIYNDYDKNIKNIKEKSVLDLFEEFFLSQNNISLNEHERDIINEIIKEVNDETTNS